MIAKIANRLETLVSHDLIALAARFGVGAIFLLLGPHQSGRPPHSE